MWCTNVSTVIIKRQQKKNNGIFENGRKSAEINKKITGFDEKCGQNWSIWTKIGQF